MKMLGQKTIPKRFNIASSILVIVYTLLLQAFSTGGTSGPDEGETKSPSDAPGIDAIVQRVLMEFEGVFLSSVEPLIRLQLARNGFESIFRLTWAVLTSLGGEDPNAPLQGPTDTLWRSPVQRPGLLWPRNSIRDWHLSHFQNAPRFGGVSIG
jgi:hypothetical protein